jgi:large subunit ribosomal protein L25
MATSASLKASPRAGTGKGSSRKLRAVGRVPAVIYGHGEETRLLSVDAHDLELLFSRIHVENTVIDVAIEGETKAVKALVREVQKHVIRDHVLHVDFYQIHAGEMVTVEIPVRITGSAPGVKLGGILQHSLSEIEVRCLPDQIPETIVVDVSELGIGDSIHVRDITPPPGVEFHVDEDRTVCGVMAPVVAAVEPGEVEEAPAEGVTEPEVIGKGKGEEDESED